MTVRMLGVTLALEQFSLRNLSKRPRRGTERETIENGLEDYRHCLFPKGIIAMQRRGTVRKGLPSNSKRKERGPCKGHCPCRVAKRQSKSLSKGRRTAKVAMCPDKALRASSLRNYLNSHAWDEVF